MTSNILTRYEHEVEAENQDYQCIYNVYSLWYGTVDDEESFCDLAEAEKYYDEIVKSVKKTLEENPAEYGTSEASVHLYDTVNGNIILSDAVLEQD